MAKILFFFTSSFPYGTGETFIENEINYLAKAFDKIVIISNDTQNQQTREVPANTKLYRLPYALPKVQKLLAYKNMVTRLFRQEFKIIRHTYQQKFTRGILNTMCQTLQKARFWTPQIKQIMQQEAEVRDQLYLYSYWNNDIAFALARYKQQQPKVKAISRMHGWDVYFEANALGYLPFRSFIFEKLDAVYAISQKGKNYYKDWFPTLQDKIRISYLGTEPQGKNPENESPELQLLTISNSIAIKNLRVLIDALALLELPFHWTHFGDGNLQESLYQHAEALIPGQFSFKGRVPNAAIFKWLQANPVDLMLNVSLSEGIPVSLMEAMSLGIPCMATDVGGTAEIVNTKNGFLLGAKPRPQELAARLKDFAQLAANEKEALRQEALKIWKEKFSAEKNYAAFLEQILA